MVHIRGTQSCKRISSESLVIIFQSYCDKTLTWGKVFPSSCLSLFNTCSVTGSTATLLRLQKRDHDAHSCRCHNKGDFVNYSVNPNTQTEDWYCESQSTFIQLRRVRYDTLSPSFTVKSFVPQRWSSGQKSWAPTTFRYFYLIFFLVSLSCRSHLSQVKLVFLFYYFLFVSI